LLETFRKGLSVQSAGPASQQGRQARKLTFQNKPPALGEPVPSSKSGWRDSIKVISLKGQAILDEATGVALEASFRGKFSFSSNGQTYVAALTASHSVTRADSEHLLTAPPSNMKAPSK